jgi:hypothetical protein
MTTTAPPTPLRHAAYLAGQVSVYAAYLDHEDPSARLVGLQAIADALSTSMHREEAAGLPGNPAQPSLWRRVLRRSLQ